MLILMMVMMLITQYLWYQVTKTVDPGLKLGQLTLHLTQSTLSHQQSEKIELCVKLQNIRVNAR